MVWKFVDDRPVYQQIMTILRGAALRGEYQSGQRIPSVRDLACAARVNPNTMQRALSELEREGLLISCGTQGRVITDDQQVLSTMRRQMRSEVIAQCVRQLREAGMESEAALLEAAQQEE